MKIRLVWLALAVACLWPVVVCAQSNDSSPENTSAFLKDMERKASEVNSDDAKWVRRDFSYAFEDEAVGEDRRQQLIQVVRALEENRTKFSVAVLGYMRGARILLQRKDWKAWADWHTQIDYFLTHPKERKESESFLELAEGLFSQGLLYQSTSATWYFRGGQIGLGTDAQGMPVWDCSMGTLVCLSKGDSARVREVSGQHRPLEERFYGASGKVEWERTTNEGELSAELGLFEVRVKGSSFSTEQARLRSTLFDLPLEGVLIFKVQGEDKIQQRTYPRFESRTGRVVLEDVFPGVSFEGGLQVRGSKLAGTGSDNQWAKLSIMNHDTLFIQCWSDQVLFSDNSIDATHARLSLLFGEDSIYHPDIKVKYLDEQKLFRATRQTEGVGQQPFIDTYHAIEMEVEAVEWELNSPSVVFRRLTSDRPEPAAFRSLDCFELDVYDQMMGIDPIHPLAELATYMARRGVTSFYSEEYADFLGLQEEQARMLLIGLTNSGYVDLDVATHFCEVKPRAERHIKARKGVIDYDVLAFYSNPNQSSTNAVLSLNNRRLELKGIGRFGVSEAQDVKIIPDGGELALGKNRSFEFNGVIQAGKFELRGAEFAFDYDAFKLDVRQAESLRILVEIDGEFDAYGQKMRWMASTIEEITGTLEIDHPNNKSGWKSDRYTQYPILTSREVSHVYYDAGYICGGAYHRDDFNYAVDPFVIDSLDNFKKEDLIFEGELLAGGIVPDLVEPLRLMEDYSLGFTRKTPPQGYPLYEGLGTVTGDLTLNLGGLHGPGSIDFLTSHLEGEDNTLVPDSAYGRTTLYDNVARTGSIPLVSASVADFGLQSYGKRLYVRSTPLDSLQFFGEDVYLKGELELTEPKMTGRGTFMFERAELASQDFLMKERTIDADVAAFELQGSDLNEVAFGTDNVSAHVDFDLRRGDFKAHDGATLIDLPAIRYQCLMDEFSWFMDEERLDLMNTLIDPSAMTFQELADRDQSNFFSLHADQDDLHFLSPRATYKVDEAYVKCEEVKSIAVADAEIKPGDGVLVVRRDALMDPLQGAEIFANDVTRYHRLYDANVQINGRLDYEGAASKTYVDAQGIEWPIRLNELAVDTAYRTYGHGLIRSGEDFFLSPQFAYQGRVHLEAGRKDLEFEGGAQMQFECDDYPNEWVEFKGVINPQDVAIPIDSMVTELGKSHLGVGWTFNDGGIKSMYPTFFTKKPVRSDVSFFVPRGFLRYDKRKDRYVVCADEKLKNPLLPGNLTQLSRGGCDLYQQGRASFPLLDKHLFSQTYIGDISTSSDQMVMRGGMIVDMPMPEPVLKYLNEVIDASDRASGASYSITNYETMLNEMVGVDAAAPLLNELSILDQYKKDVPKEVRHTLVLHGMEWRYDNYDDVWVSEGEVGLATMGEHNVWRSMAGKVAIDREKNRFILYLHFGAKQWYYFEWKASAGLMTVQAKEQREEGQQTLELLLSELKDSEKEIKEGAKRFKVQWIPGTGVRSDFTDTYREFDE
ncbi:MAG: hypothetical protein O2990_00915 [Bacteroidetes bacterium]|nr:hypothetical protein [Bacteroidota bacterium]